MRHAVSLLWPVIPAWHRRSPLCSTSPRAHGRRPSLRACATFRAPRSPGNSRRTTGAVAEAVGYQSEAAFQRAFKSHMGVTPAQWRKMQEPSGRDVFARPAAPAEAKPAKAGEADMTDKRRPAKGGDAPSLA